MHTQKAVRLFRYFKLRSIKSRFFAIVLPPVIVSFLLVSIFAGVLAYHEKEKELLNYYRENAKSYVKLIGLSLWNMSHDGVDSQLQFMLNNPDISGVKLVEALGGDVFTAGEIPDDNQMEKYLVSSVDILHVVIDKPEGLGVLYIYSPKQKIFDFLVNRFLRDSFLFFFLTVTVVVSALFANHQAIVVPLEKLLTSIREFNDPEGFKPVEWTADDEIGEVISAHNGLIISLEMGNSQIREALKKERDASRIKGEFLANMSHEIRTPLNGIMGMAELMLDTSLNFEQQNLIKTINMESESLLNIINDILDFSKIEAGKLELESIPFDLRHTIENLSASLAVHASKKKIEFIHYVDTHASTDLIGNPGRLRQILVNLAGNAIKFTHEGEVFIKCEMTRLFDQKAVFLFTVKDTGIGIPEDKHEKIFDSFSQADGSTTRKYGGTGLGVTISKMLVEKMGGQIGLRSEPGKGTEFFFEIEFFRQGPQTKTEDLSKMVFDGLTMLVVDDAKTNREVLSRYLTSWGSLPLSSESGNETLSLLDTHEKENKKIDVILIDYQMPGMDGFELAEKIRDNPFYKDTPIVILTSMGMVGDAKQCRQIGVNGYLTKPVRQNDLKLFVACVLGQAMNPEEVQKNLITRHTLAEFKRNNTRVLLVEDYETNQKLVTRQLENAGFFVTLAKNGKEAVDIFPSKEFDIVLMDIQMPVMDGYEATSHIRRMEKKEKRTPIIAMTAHAIQGYREKCLEAGMDDYITKPLKKENLLSTISRWIQPEVDQPTLGLETIDPSTPLIPQNDVLAIDYKKALAEFGDDEDFFHEVFQEFLITVKNQLQCIAQAIEANDPETVKKESHAIKGGAANLVAIPLSTAAADLEEIGKSEHLGPAKLVLKKLIMEFERLKAFR